MSPLVLTLEVFYIQDVYVNFNISCLGLEAPRLDRRLYMALCIAR